MRVEPDLSQRGRAVRAEHLYRQPVSRGTGLRGRELDLAKSRIVGGKGGELRCLTVHLWLFKAEVVYRRGSWRSFLGHRICYDEVDGLVSAAVVSSRIQRRSMLSATSKSRAACATATPRSVTSLTASILKYRLNFHLVTPTLPFLGHDLIFVSTKPVAGQSSSLETEPIAEYLIEISLQQSRGRYRATTSSMPEEC